MLRLIPPVLHRMSLRFAHAARKRWWRLRRPRLNGCRVLAFDGARRILLIRHSYGSGQWMPPGGGIGRGETPLAAALRELREETGCALDGAVEVAQVTESLHGAGNRVHVVAGRTDDGPVADRREVMEARFFAPDALPADMPAGLRADIPGWIRAYNRES